jgi:DNA-binding protein H-NS
MGRPSYLEKMSVKELTQMEVRIQRLKIEKQNSERVAVRKELSELAKQHGFDLRDLIGKARKGKGSVAVKYRDPKDPQNTWTGRGRMPRWLTAATKSGKTRDSFLV